MLSALLPGVREFRTPLVTGLLWAASLWMLAGPTIVESQATAEFIEGFGLTELPVQVWTAATALLAYLLGSLLVVRESPFGGREHLWKELVRARLEWMDPPSEEAAYDEESLFERDNVPWGWKLQRRLWHRTPTRIKMHLHRWVYDERPIRPLEMWLRNMFDSHVEEGRVPLMRAFAGGVMGPRGFDAFFDPRSLPDESWRAGWGPLGDQFLAEIRSEKPAVEARIQMRYPEVYAEIDRLKVEGEFRFSIFWPLLALIAVLAWSWSPLALLLWVAPPFLLRDGFRRKNESEEKVWAALLSGEVTAPTLDVMKQMQTTGELLDFKVRYPGYPGPEEDRDL